MSFFVSGKNFTNLRVFIFEVSRLVRLLCGYENETMISLITVVLLFKVLFPFTSEKLNVEFNST